MDVYERLSYPGNNSNDCPISLESALIKLYKTLKSAEECRYAESITFSDFAGLTKLTVFETYIAECGSFNVELTLLFDA